MLGSYSLTQVIVFSIIVVVALLIDLFSHRGDKAISIKNAAIWSIFWVLLSFGFAGYIAYDHGVEHSTLFIAGYLLEKSLSVDNLFVFMAIFSSFSIRDEYQHRVLYYGIVGALILRLVFIAAGTSLIAVAGKYALSAFGLFVLWSAFKMWQESRKEEEEVVDYAHHWAVNLTRRILPVSRTLDGHNFFTRVNGKLSVTPLFLCLLIIEAADVMFAFDSVPAVIGITQDPFLVYTSNIFAILGLRSMYFMLAAAKRYLCHLETSVIAILAFIGIKMLLDVAEVVHIKPMISLAIVGSLLTGGIIASYLCPKKEK